MKEGCQSPGQWFSDKECCRALELGPESARLHDYICRRYSVRFGNAVKVPANHRSKNYTISWCPSRPLFFNDLRGNCLPLSVLLWLSYAEIVAKGSTCCSERAWHQGGPSNHTVWPEEHSAKDCLVHGFVENLFENAIVAPHTWSAFGYSLHMQLFITLLHAIRSQT